MNNEEILKSRLFTRRALIMGVSKMSLLSLLIGRLYYLQIIKSDDYKTLSENNSVKAIFTHPARGNITDRHEILLAGNKNKYGAVIEKKFNKDFKHSLDELLKLLDITEETKNQIILKLSNQKNVNSEMVHTPLTWQEVVNIEVNSYNLPGVHVDVAQERNYNYGDICANIIGYVAPASEQEAKEQPILKYQDLKIGKNGIEKFFETSLMGEFGVKRVEVNAHGVHLRELSVENSIPGDNLALSIDISLQQYISNLLSQHVGSVVVMDIENGEILAMNSSPSFNPNNIVEGISTKDWNKLLTDPNTPMLNKCISNHYPPGSIFKLITALASLKEGNSPSAIYNCKGYVVVGDRKFHCWKEHGHGDVNLTEAISQSCNCYFYNLAKKIGIDNIAHMAEIFGFGKKTHIELPNEINGLIPDRKWKISRFNKSWQIGDTINCAIGQGFVLTTPIQLAIMVSRIASGKKILPTILLDGNKDKEFETLEVSDTDLDAIRLGMFKAVNDYMGTSFRHRLDDEHFQMAGKTGTSQVVSKKGEKDDLSKKSTAWLHRNHGLFVSYAPFDKPKYAISVVIEHGGSGSGDAAPVARSIFTEIHNKVSTRQEIS